MSFAYSVFASYDGCLDDQPLFSGGHDQCLTFLRKNWSRWNKGKTSLDLRDNRSGRLISFVLREK